MIKNALLLIFPILFSATMHMIVVKLNLFKMLKVPINKKLFGENKTYRGPIIMVPLSILGVFTAIKIESLLTSSPTIYQGDFSIIILGSFLGLAYIIGELPNSWIKRRLKIAPGKQSEKYRWHFSLLDQLDSAIPCLTVLFFYLNLELQLIIATLFISLGVKLVVNLALYKLGIRNEPF